MNQKVRNWLAAHFGTTSKYIDGMLKDENATTYLLIWPIFEQKLFNGFMRSNDIEGVAKKYSPYYSELSVDNYAAHFHNRYQNNTHYRHLQHGDRYSRVTPLLQQAFNFLSEEDKLVLMIYVVYRFRNNIFHGNKGIESWSQYKTEIQYCLDFMMNLINCAEKHKGEIL